MVEQALPLDININNVVMGDIGRTVQELMNIKWVGSIIQYLATFCSNMTGVE